jgi:hypothetical protein
MKMDRSSLRAWLDARRAAAMREREEACSSPLPAAESLRCAMRLIALSSELHGWPLPEDEHSLDEDWAGYERWSRLRAAVLGKHGTRPGSEPS